MALVLGLTIYACGANAGSTTTESVPTTLPLTTSTTVVITTTTSIPPTTSTTTAPYPYDFVLHPEAPVIRPGTWDSSYTAVPWVIVRDDTWYLFYAGAKGRDAGLGLATSADGIDWVKQTRDGPLYMPSGSGLGWFFIFQTDEGWELLYVTGFSPPYRTVNRATASSFEGPWEDMGEAFQAPDREWDRFIVPTGVTKIGDTYYMPYGGWGQLVRIPAIGILTSSDGIAWQPMTEEPIYTATDGTWDEKGVVPMNIVETERGLELFYLGFSEPPRVGFQAEVIPFGRLISTDGGATWIADNEGLPIGDTGEKGWPGVTVVYRDGTYSLYLGDDLGGSGISLVTGTIP